MKTLAELQGGPFHGQRIEVGGFPEYIYRPVRVDVSLADPQTSPTSSSAPIALYEYAGRWKDGQITYLAVFKFVRVVGGA